MFSAAPPTRLERDQGLCCARTATVGTIDAELVALMGFVGSSSI